MTFKIIVTGITGRIGSEVLQQCLKNPTITSIIALSRRPLPDLAEDPRLDLIVVEKFDQYSEDLLAKLSGADGCVWCMTTTSVEPRLELDYPEAFATAFLTTFAHSNKSFRYVHLSGAMVERDQSKTLWMKAPLRKLKGQGEVQALEFANKPAADGRWETYIARPGGVVKRGTIFGEAAVTVGLGSGWAIRSDELALALIDTAINGHEEQLLLPGALTMKGQELKAKRNGL